MKIWRKNRRKEKGGERRNEGIKNGGGKEERKGEKGKKKRRMLKRGGEMKIEMLKGEKKKKPICGFEPRHEFDPRIFLLVHQCLNH